MTTDHAVSQKRCPECGLDFTEVESELATLSERLEWLRSEMQTATILAGRKADEETWEVADLKRAVNFLRERAEKAERERDAFKKIAGDWQTAADYSQQPVGFYKDYSEATMRAMQALKTKSDQRAESAESSLAAAVAERDEANKWQWRFSDKLMQDEQCHSWGELFAALVKLADELAAANGHRQSSLREDQDAAG